jgi:hypothetical protein
VEDDAPPGSAPTLDLPDIATLGAGSDYAAFLQKGVAAVVQQQALARAWTTDAGIAGFRGMADYDWDFNAVGYGRLWAADDVASLLRAVLSPEPEAPADAAPEPATDGRIAAAEPVAVRISAQPAAVEREVVAVETAEEAPAEQAGPRRHGSALPS